MELIQMAKTDLIDKEEWNWDNIKEATRAIIKFTIELCPDSSSSHLIQLFKWILDDLEEINKKQNIKISEENIKKFGQEMAKLKGSIILDLLDEHIKNNK